ncbi:proline--tRNA ligase [Paenibacillus hemerocallicola]|uniref:Proline--tRNA ligase n=1 Tax=Paenibacillus hemerocallicola TaxID=1172614 RepID=A0A5C4T3C6_9BACL|nr:proline--tRNA ligase [Paenibacillus hemerocallicola]TNJ63543.1 proline--tRNA ligase [Paenibacillus hemerocallicola]
MRFRQTLIPTLRDDPSDAETASHRFMVRAGLIRQLASGIYTYLPLGFRVLRNVERIVREEMEKAGAVELLLPALHPAELWQESGRWDVYGDELMRLKDRNDRPFALGATHEEAITALVRDEVKSYKKLPLTLYQIQTKFRDERRPRYGLLRGREFIMKDAYSFDASQEGLDRSYTRMYDAYSAIFRRCGLSFRAIEADSGAIGGTDTHEFMALADIGEDTIVHCAHCHYAANLELAECTDNGNAHTDKATMTDDESVRQGTPSASGSRQIVETPDVKTIAQLTRFLGIGADRIVKSIALLADGLPVVALVRGDRELNETKVRRLLGATTTELMTEQHIAEKLGSVPGYIGPVGLPDHVAVIADEEIRGMRQVTVGANASDRHLVGVDPERDFRVSHYGDLRTASPGDRCARCGGELRFDKGIEVGHVFKLGTKYSEAMRATYLDDTGKSRPYIMGCYGIGVSRLLSAIVEQHHDEAGIVWPTEITPYRVHLIVVQNKDPVQKELAESLYDGLRKTGCEVLYDDRDDRPGAKFADADLLGLPLRVTVGKRASEGIVECKRRNESESFELEAERLPDFVRNL